MRRRKVTGWKDYAQEDIRSDRVEESEDDGKENIEYEKVEEKKKGNENQ